MSPETLQAKDLNISIVIPALNEENYIANCINSLQGQIGSQDELIVVDNGSTDKTARIAKELGCTVVSEQKRGVSHARNRGAEVSSNPVLGFVDADGVVHNNWLQEAKRSLADPRVSAVSGLNIFNHDSRLKEIWYNGYTVFAYAYVLILQACSKTFLVSNNLAIKKDVFDDIDRWKPIIGEDYWLSKEFWKRDTLHGAVNLRMRIDYSSRRFDQQGYLRTISNWITQTLRRTSQEKYRQSR